jgi:8-oxo-dGTP pyrophosphatase MutT (NUDIX family)
MKIFAFLNEGRGGDASRYVTICGFFHESQAVESLSARWFRCIPQIGGRVENLRLNRLSKAAFHNPAMTRPWKPSVTVAAIISRPFGGVQQFLLVEEHTPEGLKLNNPAGHLDPEESPQQGVVREVLEETTCSFVPECLVGTYLSRFQRPTTGEDVTYVRFAFGGTVGAPDPARQLDDGIVRTLWLTLPELRASVARHRSPLVLRCVEDFVAGRRYPLGAITTDASVYSSTHAPEVKP